MELNKLTQAAIAIAREAGEKIMAVYNSADFSVEHKDDNSPLTAADLASHHHIVAALTALTPQYPVLSEENASELPFEERSQWQTYWLVDPLDGTKEFIKRNDEFSILIALVHDNVPILGVVHAPVLKTSWFASKGSGAFKQTGNDTKSISVRESGAPLAVVGSRSHASAGLQAFLKNIGEYELVSMGSILKACMVAEGTADIYPRIGLTSEWDTAAAQIIVEEAGGYFTRTDMQPLRYNTKESLLNPHFFVFGKQYRDWSRYLLPDA
ncbi:MAG: 3'(2'),5'-bisphosphate nucleotidase CysQ [Gammaproteobacteria bacterium]|nr:3'(2'),5'-bisphosphate nucleotidase CysQ [Gammaproteobacteria bacterium]MBU1724265.1 3'(2'),5'-bisphosphate nucleotidase CysQ [Gammaproteobacteria bacterium]MBU2006307.1 3'(2'),5'-bisphosphate nucleotidase CysQ [Gammaproteobacteria bacterium]